MKNYSILFPSNHINNNSIMNMLGYLVTHHIQVKIGIININGSFVPMEKMEQNHHGHLHCASTSRALGMPGHGSSPKVWLATMMEHLLFPRHS